MSDQLNKSSSFERAEQLLAAADTSSLRYCALELRFCLEATAYDKLQTYQNRLPKSLLREWRPPQALRALVQLEPGADQDFTLRIGRETEKGVAATRMVSMGSHKTLSAKVITKHYNKLGGLLHVPTRDQGAATRPEFADPTRVRMYLEEVLELLRPVVASELDASIAETIGFQCRECGETITANLAGVRESKRAYCLNPDCEAEYLAVVDNGEAITFKPDEVSIDCPDCGKRLGVQKKRIELGFHFQCEHCDSRFLISEFRFAVAKIDENQSGS